MGKIGTGVVLFGIAATSFLLHFGSWVDQSIQRMKERRLLQKEAAAQAVIDHAEEVALAEVEVSPEPEIIPVPAVPLPEEVTTITNTFIAPEPTDEDLLSQIEIISPVEEEEEETERETEPEIGPTEMETVDLTNLESDLGMEVQGPANEEILSSEEVDERLADFGDYDPKLDLSRYEAPSIELLKNHTTGGIKSWRPTKTKSLKR
jgi:S-DNA-T family DNA segregation ATPase FtsK/SpoIIIE